MEDVDLGLNTTATLSLLILDYIVVVINVVTMGEANMGHKRPANITLSIVEQVFMVMGEVDIGRGFTEI